MPIVGKKCYAVYHDRTEPCEICPSIRTLSSGKPDFEVVPLITKEQTYWFETYTFPLYDFKTGQISGVIEHVRNITKRKQAEDSLKESREALRAHTRRLEELNTALKVLLEHREKDKEKIQEKVLSNVNELILPNIEALKKTRLDTRQMEFVGIIESHLTEIVSPFLRNLALKYSGLTPKETQVATLIKQGKTTKEIAEFLNVSTGAVKFHRHNMRAKLGLKNRRTNLGAYLLSLSWY
jgi:DNA-binding CsgD family transcriptional regulator